MRERPRTTTRFAIPSREVVRLTILSLLAAGLPGLVPVHADEPPALKVRLEQDRGPYYVGQGIDLAVGVTAGDQRPSLELPRPATAELWVVDTAFRPVSVSGIGRVVLGSNQFLTRLRLVARRAGMLDIPPITARVDGRIGRTPATRLRIEPVPLEGRPAGFLGGVGDFTVRASVTPGTVMVGQEFEYRIEVAGPAAWGMIARPPLDRLGQLPIAPRVEPLADSETREPATRTFAWRIRPTRPGSVVLPPVAIAAFDPASRRYLTKVSPGTPVRVVATPGPAVDSLSYSLRPDQRGRGAAWAWLAFLTSLVGGAIGLVLLARQQRRRPRTGRRAARTFARDAARRWDGEDGQTPDAATELDVAWRILAELIDYARIGLGRPAGAITPEEAAMVVRQMSGDEDLAQEAASLCEGCDRVLFSGNGTREERRLRDGARRLFTALGRAEVSREGGLSETRARTSD